MKLKMKMFLEYRINKIVQTVYPKSVIFQYNYMLIIKWTMKMESNQRWNTKIRMKLKKLK